MMIMTIDVAANATINHVWR